MSKKGTTEAILAYSTAALALFTVVMAFATLRLASESREASFRQIRVQTWLEFEKRFDSADMIRARKKLAQWFKTENPAQDAGISEKVLNFFDDLGAAYEMGYIDKQLADNAFSLHACRWWEVSKSYVDKERKRQKNPSLFDRFESVARLMRQPGEKIDDEELRRFLEDESRLVED